MKKKVLLVHTTKSFMVNAMIKNLNGEGYDVVSVRPDPEAFDAVEDRPPVVLLYVDTEVDELTGFLHHMKERDEDLYVIASEEELSAVRAAEPDLKLAGEERRPINVKKLVDSMDSRLGGEDAQPKERRILVVDDDGTMLRTLKLWLSDKYRVFMANSGPNAMTVIEQNEVDLILLDYEMPGMSGPEVLKEIRSDSRYDDIPIMFLTAKNDAESAEMVEELHPDKYLLKTMPPDVLLESIEGFFQK